ncbi:hypothetical protein HG531_011838 [Fusarium graminearum]|nr:hypothetical protein HG531_011838 [Fusarium graminearum]
MAGSSAHATLVPRCSSLSVIIRLALLPALNFLKSPQAARVHLDTLSNLKDEILEGRRIPWNSIGRWLGVALNDFVSCLGRRIVFPSNAVHHNLIVLDVTGNSFAAFKGRLSGLLQIIYCRSIKSVLGLVSSFLVVTQILGQSFHKFVDINLLLLLGLACKQAALFQSLLNSLSDISQPSSIVLHELVYLGHHLVPGLLSFKDIDGYWLWNVFRHSFLLFSGSSILLQVQLFVLTAVA